MVRGSEPFWRNWRLIGRTSSGDGRYDGYKQEERMNITRWNLMGLAMVICIITPYAKTALANSSYPLTSNRISFATAGPRIYSDSFGSLMSVRLDIVSPHKKIDHIVLQSRGSGAHSNVYAAATVDVNKSGRGDERINVPNAQRVSKVVRFPSFKAACGENTLYENAWVKGGGGRIGSPSNALTFWKDCEPPRVQLQLKRMDGSTLGGPGRNKVYGDYVVLEVGASDDQGIKDIVVKDSGLTRTLGSRQFSHGLKRSARFQVRIPVGAYSDQPVGIRVFVRDWIAPNNRTHLTEGSTGYTIGTVQMNRVTPARIAPGQAIRISGRFNTNAFNSHRFKLWMAPPVSGAGIDLPLRRVSETAIDATIPRNLRAGRYTILVKDTVSNNSFVGHAQAHLEIMQGSVLHGAAPDSIKRPKVMQKIRTPRAGVPRGM